jgi:VanZ family protein
MMVLITAFIPLTSLSVSLSKITFGPGSFQIRLDYLLHITIYFIICMYYLAGQWKGLMLFNKNSLKKFILLILLLATATEVIQLFIPARMFNLWDWVGNVSGVMIGLLIIIIAGKKIMLMAKS